MADTSNMGMGGYVNPYLDKQNPQLQQIIDNSTGDLTRSYNMTAVPAQNKAAVQSGSFGNSALAEGAAYGAEGLGRNIADATAKLRFNDYTQQQDMYKWDQSFGRDLFNDSYAQNMGNANFGLSLLGMLNGQSTQDLSDANTIQDTPLNYWQTFNNAANGLGQGFGSSSSTTGTTSNPALTAAGGAQLGQSLWNRNTSNTTAPISQENQANFDSFGGSNGWWGTA